LNPIFDESEMDKTAFRKICNANISVSHKKHEMKINIKNLGIIKNAEIDLSKDLIVFTGYNNTGKTYLNYLLYGLYKIPYGRIEKQFFNSD